MAAAGTTIDPEVDLVVQQVVVGQGGSDDVTYALRLRDGKVEVAAGRAEDADITFTQDRETAADIASGRLPAQAAFMAGRLRVAGDLRTVRSEKHTSELQSLMRISYAVFCLKKKKQ